jgi:hypothetical protein
MSTKDVTRWDARMKDLDAAALAGDTAATLAYAGDLLRRATAFGVDVSKVDAAIARVGKDKALAHVASIDAGAIRTRFERGIEDAFEALIEQDAIEKATFERKAMEALFERDALESARVAVEHAIGVVAELEAKVAAVDAGLATRARCLVGLNAHRRQELALLDPEAQRAAWWFASRVESDAVGEVLAGRKDPKLAKQALGSKAEKADVKDLGRLAGVSTPPRRVDERSLWLREIGAASPERARWAEKHVDAVDAKALDTDVE